MLEPQLLSLHPKAHALQEKDHKGKPAHTAPGEQPPLAVIRESPHAATKTWCGQKEISANHFS